MNGQVRMFSDFRGFGFVRGDDGRDYFVHYSMITGEGYRSLLPDEAVTFDPVETPRGWQAWNLRRQASGAQVSRGYLPGFRLKLNPFTPQDPVTDPRKFAGRAEAIANAIDCLFNNKNLLVTGARGIGKSSLAYQLLNLTRGDKTLIDRIGIDTGGFEFNHITGDHRCIPGQTLEAITNGLLGSLAIRHRLADRASHETRKREWDLKVFKASTEVVEQSVQLAEVALRFAVLTEDLLQKMDTPTTGICYLIDEVDVLDSGIQLAPFLKAVVEKLRLDGYGNVSFLLSGVTGSITDLIAQHPSAARLTETLTLQRMTPEELGIIIHSALEDSETKITAEAVQAVIELSGSFPAPVHLLGYHAFRLNADGVIDLADVAAARDFVVREIKRQDFQGRLDRIGGGTGSEILRILAGPTAKEMTVQRITARLGEDVGRVGSTLGDLQRDGFVQRRGSVYEIAEPLFAIYLRWIFGIS